MFDINDAVKFLAACDQDCVKNNTRLGQEILNKLGDENNPEIYYTLDNEKVYQWFYDNKVNY